MHFDRLKRREFITLLGGVGAWPLAARGQQPAERMRRIGILADERWPPIDSLKEGLRNLGYIEGQNLEVVYRFAEGQAERYPGLAAELVALPVELIVALGTPASVAAKRATEAIPIVVQTGDPVAAGLVRDLAHPGPKDHQDEVTGMTDLWRWSASDLARAIRTRQVSSRDAVHACLTRIEQVNPRINAIVECRTEEALAGADAADAAVARGEELGPLHGVPVTIKGVGLKPSKPVSRPTDFYLCPGPHDLFDRERRADM